MVSIPDQVRQQGNGVGVSGPAWGQPDTAGEGREAPKYGDNAWQGSPEGFITTIRTLETSMEGVFAASDGRGVSTKQTGG